MSLVDSFTHLGGRPKADKALPLLQRIASLVKPIMRNHAWRLPCLSEFFPENPSLVGLNVNGGQKILLRLRPAWAPDTFYEEEDIVKVMLHELTHNVHGPHDDKFYKFLASLEEEYEKLKRTGYSGEGFHSKGTRLGVGKSHDLPPHLARLKAVAAAERRKSTSNVLGGGGRVLGGSPPRSYRSPKELAAEAAERRAKDENACGTVQGEEILKEVEKAAKDSAKPVAHIIDLTQEDELTKPSVSTRRPTTLPEAVKPSATPSPLSKVKATVSPKQRKTDFTRSQPQEPSKSSDLLSEWSCPRCTLVNGPHTLTCGACSYANPVKPLNADGWACLTCGETGIPHQFWSCSFCGNVKQSSDVAV